MFVKECCRTRVQTYDPILQSIVVRLLIRLSYTDQHKVGKLLDLDPDQNESLIWVYTSGSGVNILSNIRGIRFIKLRYSLLWQITADMLCHLYPGSLPPTYGGSGGIARLWCSASTF